jgi:hypothetical protein
MFKDLKSLSIKTKGSGDINIGKSIDNIVTIGKGAADVAVKVTKGIGNLIKTAYLNYKKHFSKKDMQAI